MPPSDLKKESKFRFDEIIYSVIRSSMMLYWPQLLISGLLIILAAFFIYPLVQQGVWGIVADIAVAIVGLFIFIRTYVGWRLTRWVITDRGIVDVFQKGFTHQEKTQANYSQIENVYGKKTGLLGSLLGLGDVYVLLAGGRVKLRLPACPRYSQLISLINERREERLDAVSSSRERKAQLLLLKIKKKLGEDKFNKLIFD